MTVNTELARAEAAWTGVETAFPAGFPADKAADVNVFYRTPAGVISVMTAGVNHSVTLAGGSNLVTVLPLSLPAAPGTVVISRKTPSLVSEVLEDGEGFSLKIIQQLHDRAAMRSAEDRALFARAIVLEEGASLGQGDFNLGGSGLANVAPGTTAGHAATVGQLQDLIIASGNVPAPVLGDVGRFLVATAPDAFAWVALVLSMIPDGFFTADAAGLAKFADAFLSADAAGRAKMAAGFLSADATGRAKMADKFVTNAKLADMVAARLKGALVNGAPVDLTGEELRDGILPSGFVVDRAYAQNASYFGPTTAMPYDDTVPLITEGVEVCSLPYAMKSLTNRLRIRFKAFGSTNTGGYITAALFDGSTNALEAAPNTFTASGYVGPVVLESEFVPGTLASKTYSVRVGPGGSATACYINGEAAGRRYGGVAKATMIIEEIKA